MNQFNDHVSPKQKKGFALLTPERRKEIASMGGITAHLKGRAHQWTPEEASKAGMKGGFMSKGGGRRKKETSL